MRRQWSKKGPSIVKLGRIHDETAFALCSELQIFLYRVGSNWNFYCMLMNIHLIFICNGSLFQRISFLIPDYRLHIYIIC